MFSCHHQLIWKVTELTLYLEFSTRRERGDRDLLCFGEVWLCYTHTQNIFFACWRIENSQTSSSMVIIPFYFIITSKEMSLSGLYLLINLYVHIIEPMVFLVVVQMWELDAFELWCWRSLWRVPWTGRSNQSILKEINPEYSLEGLILRL